MMKKMHVGAWSDTSINIIIMLTGISKEDIMWQFIELCLCLQECPNSKAKEDIM